MRYEKRNKRSSSWRWARQRIRRVLLVAWVLAVAASVALYVAEGEWRGLFWCGYALYADLIFAL